MKDFRLSIIVTIVCLAIAAYWGTQNAMGWWYAVLIALTLGVMEVSLSFDNAVVNASVLKEMDAKWQKIFLTIGILIAVFGMRLIFPIVIVAVATGLGFSEVTAMALENPDEYSRHLTESHAGIAAFGGTFLLLVFYSFIFDEGKDIHWLGKIEEKIAKLGKVDSIGVLAALLVILGLYLWLPVSADEKLTILSAGIGGVILFIAVSSIDSLFESENEEERSSKVATRNGVAGFLYLEVLDASFSFDGVIGAFAITRDVVIIMLGLGIGAMFVRSLTVFLVKKGTLDEYVYLEHGAHYAIGALAVIMLAGIVIHIPEIITGLIGVTFIALALISSIRLKRRELQQQGE
ncbi:MAG: DUF475 domain-containing protein [Campylobacteraceae bacterium]|jgi:hypothetical protein|nr:DUF475 domain-containing protein [Campylobacteraceae bacterium]